MKQFGLIRKTVIILQDRGRIGIQLSLISASSEILCAVLSRCVPEILEAVSIDGYYGEPMCNELLRLCSSSGSQHSLKKLNISRDEYGPLLDDQIILAVKAHFKDLTCLSIQGRSYGIWDEEWSTVVFSDSLSTVCELLNQTSIQELWLSIPCINFDRATVLEYLNEPVTETAEFEDVTESDLERGYRKLIVDIASACHRIRKLVIVQQSKTRYTPDGINSRSNVMGFTLVGTRSPGKVMEVKLY
ncbi:hypothetical protein FAGAP_11069 [Fusarium agapanthi]|uniref:Uncharacterized protein n=1 Tax=Fusarium agapanthi TaxID=1803897 RepID=A0A9P5AZQ5_9HYPO|nr:hypothetical protein FAGAP_11069 [Fusarium agapanthi]